MLDRVAMRRVRNQKQVRKRLLLDPEPRPVELEERGAAQRGGIAAHMRRRSTTPAWVDANQSELEAH
jgi:hypothetical protein